MGHQVCTDALPALDSTIIPRIAWKRILSTIGTARNACATSGVFYYQRHRSESTLLYQLVLKHYQDFRRQLAEEGSPLPDYVQREVEV